MTRQNRTLYLHIGQSKAGSTSIQRHLSRAHKRHARLGLFGFVARPRILPVRAFGLPNAVLLAADAGGANSHHYFVLKRKKFTEDAFSDIRANLWQTTQQEIARARVSRFVSSSEHLFSFLDHAHIERLHEKLHDVFDEVRVILYLRDQLKGLPALWAQSVKGPARSGKTFAEFVKDIEKTPPRWDYTRNVPAWLEVFGHEALSVALFDRSVLQDGDVISDFCHRVGMDPLHGTQATQPRNVTPGWGDVEKMRRQNLVLSGNADTTSDPQAEIAAFESNFIQNISAGNAWVNETFFADQSVKLPV